MDSSSDTLNIGSIRLRKEYPVAEVQAIRQNMDPVIHPEAAAAARARIAAIGDNSAAMVRPETVPAAPTADLVTDRHVLAKQVATTSIVSRHKIPSALSPVLTAVGVFLLTLLLFKSPIIISQLSYTLSHKANPAPVAATQAAAVIPSANTISIPKINVAAPVEYGSSVQESDIEGELENGVVHYATTAVPGEVGNVAIFGHSSNDWWQPGNYKFVFVLLDKLAPGDQVSLNYQSKRYIYQVTGSQVVDPTDVSVLNPTPTATLSLITCTPPGTSLRRLVVTAKQIYPAPPTAAPAQPSATTTATNLPSSAPDLMGQVDQAWTGVVNGIKSLFGEDTTPASTSPTAAPGAATLPAAN